MEKYLSVAKQAALEAGEFLMKNINSARDSDSLSILAIEQDKDSESLILKILKKEFPEDGFLCEESGEEIGTSEYKWIIDPIDGTNNYVAGRDTFSISIGLEKNGLLIMGLVFLPKRDELFHATLGGGAFMNDQLIKVGDQTDLDKAIVTYSVYPGREKESEGVTEKLSKNIGNLKNFGFTNKEDIDPVFGRGSMAAEFCYLACGRIDGLIRLKQKPWDVAGGSIIASEAGAMMNNLAGSDVSVYEGDYLCSNPELLKKINNLLI